MRQPLGLGGRTGAPPAQPVVDDDDEQVGRDEEHDQALDDRRQVLGQLGLEDRRVQVAHRRAVDQRAEQQRRQARADRRVASQQCHRDAQEADLRRLDVVRGQVELPAQDVERARQAGQRAAGAHDEHVGPADADAAVARGLGVEAHRPRLVALRRAVEQHPVDDGRGERHEDPDVQPLQLWVAPEDREVGAADDVVGDRDVGLRAVLQRATELEEVHPEPQRDVVEHDRGDHLVGAGRGAQGAGDPGPRGPRQRGQHHREDDVQPARHPGPRGADPDRDDAADGVLALAADVEQAGAEGVGDGQADEDQRRGDQQRLLEVDRRRVAVGARGPREQPLQARAVEDRLVGVDRVVARGQHDQAAGQERDDHRQDRGEDPASAQLGRQARGDGGPGAEVELGLGAGLGRGVTLTPRPPRQRATRRS
nr:hypothetical protein [Baekduia soli]